MPNHSYQIFSLYFLLVLNVQLLLHLLLPFGWKYYLKHPYRSIKYLSILYIMTLPANLYMLSLDLPAAIAQGLDMLDALIMVAMFIAAGCVLMALIYILRLLPLFAASTQQRLGKVHIWVFWWLNVLPAIMVQLAVVIFIATHV